MNQAHIKFTLILITAVIVAFGIGAIVGWFGHAHETASLDYPGQYDRAFGATQLTASDACRAAKTDQLDCDNLQIDGISDISNAELSPDKTLQFSTNYTVKLISKPSVKHMNILSSGSGKALGVDADWLSSEEASKVLTESNASLQKVNESFK